MANLDVILQELRDFCLENCEKLREIKEDIIGQISGLMRLRTELLRRRTEYKDTLLELLKMKTRLEMKLTDQEGLLGDNIRVHGVCEVAKRNSPSVILLLRSWTLDPSPSSDQQIVDVGFPTVMSVTRCYLVTRYSVFSNLTTFFQ